MGKSKNTIATVIVIAAVLIIGLVAYMLLRPDAENQTTRQQTNTSSPETSQQSNDENQETAIITYDGQSFSPAEVTVTKGSTVTWVDESGNGMWVASDFHPTHTAYSGTSQSEHCSGGDAAAGTFDQCSSGQRFSFTFEKTGSWKYHDHLNSGATGTVIVE